MKPTKAQQAMLDSTSSHLLVSASAGSGKTSTLIEKVSSLIESGVSLDDMLIVTFTEAASQEMRGRLEGNLRERASSNPLILPQLDLLPASDICTLHSFCSKILRQYFYKVDLKPTFSVLSEDRAQYLRSRALQKTFRHFSLTKDESFVSLVSSFGNRGYDRLRDAILNLSSFLESIEDVSAFLDKNIENAYNPDLNENTACQYLQGYVHHSIKYIISSMRELKLVAEQSGAEHYATFMQNNIERASSILDCKDFVFLRLQLSAVTLPPFDSKKHSEADDIFKEENKIAYYALRKRYDSLCDICLVDMDNDTLTRSINMASKRIAKLVEVQKLFSKFYSEEKQQIGGVDFADLERYMLRLLEDKEVADCLDKKYIFLDEYQDINSLQERIISLIAKEDTQIIMVGDVKQSIYAFRNSSPDIIKEKTRLYSSDRNSGEVIYLNDNFRSNPTILEFVNSIFDGVMDMDFGGVDYSLARLTSDIKYEVHSAFPVVDVCYIDLTDREERHNTYDKVYSVLDDDNEYEERLTLDRAGAMVIAKKIIDLVEGDNYIYDAKTKENRRVKFSDISVLCRKNRLLTQIAGVLMEYHVPISSVVSSKVYDSIEVGVLLSLLRLLYSTHDDISLVTVMTSPIAHFTHDDMARIRFACQDCSTFYEAVMSFAKGEGDLASQVKDFLSYIDTLRHSLVHLSISHILREVVDRDYGDFVLSLPGGSDRLKLVDEFIDSLKGSDYDYDLPAFLNFVDTFARDKESKIAFSSGDGCVRLTTIHASKGLEYPIVFLAGCEKDFFKNARPQDILFDSVLSIGMSSVDDDTFTKSDNLVKSAISIRKKYKEREEELRLLYVALTRAQNHLFIIGAGDRDDLTKLRANADSRLSTSYLSWIIRGLSHASFMKLLTRGEVVKDVLSGKVRYSLFSPKDFLLSSENKEGLDYIKAEHRDKSLEKVLSFESPRHSNIALKNSVSSLLQSSEDYISIQNTSPHRLTIFERNIDATSASKIGTVYHRIMEQVDFNSPMDRETFDNIVKTLNIDEKIASIIQYDKIKSCHDAIRGLSPNLCLREVPFISYLKHSEIIQDGSSEKVIVQGVADLIVDSTDKKYLVDYKTSRIESADLLVDKYKVQLHLYRICLERALNVHFDAVFIYSFQQNQLVKVF